MQYPRNEPNGIDENFPEHLTSYESLAQHIRGQVEGLTTVQKGTRFARLVQKLVPQTEIGSEFQLPVLSPKQSNDEGVDLSAAANDGTKILHIQSRLMVDRTESIDSIMSKFEAYESSHQTNMIKGQSTFLANSAPLHFMLVTLSPLTGILRKYKEKPYSSKAFYQRCVNEHRVHFVDGTTIWSIVRGGYIKIN